ncbi:MAG TPA: response regulator [Desulfobacterales bacterium]|jgi:predicted Zn finger-like uncharacterized protein|nr:response regulator [Desulfobacterales bacterium]
MEILCKNCNAKFRIADDKLPTGRTVSLKCPKCASKIEVGTPAPTPETTVGESTSDIDDASRRSLDFLGEGVETALICEQDTGVREKIRSALERMDYHVIEAESARDAMRQIRLRVFDLVVLDESFEGGNRESNHVLQYLAHLPMNPRRNIFVVLLGNALNTSDNMMALSNSVNLVVNPKDADELDKVLKRSQKEHEELYRVLTGTLRKMGRA